MGVGLADQRCLPQMQCSDRPGLVRMSTSEALTDSAFPPSHGLKLVEEKWMLVNERKMDAGDSMNKRCPFHFTSVNPSV